MNGNDLSWWAYNIFKKIYIYNIIYNIIYIYLKE